MTSALGHVLVVEDEPMIAMELVCALELQGATVVGPFAGIRQATAAIENGAKLDGAVLDLNLGGELSFSVADLLRANHIPFVFTTGYGLEDLPRRYGQIPLLAKPIDPSQVIEKLAEIMAASNRAE
ncbi:response regulator [Ensifer sp. T173]|uniref:Response regulator n=1 Tax=Ensifer canadensis TaxID=555315 RepID=A0AAW4FUI6_9HYPH|nr:response regulator [Ensifer canadensis]MBM3094991.1 response regulator [Ensifer canadensis]UBI79899.1 response regulator [Ensifer canadensis]